MMPQRKPSANGWNWHEGSVNPDEDHMKLFPKGSKDPLALVAPREGKSFVVQFLALPHESNPERTALAIAVQEELDYYLTQLSPSPNMWADGIFTPWDYAIYHCRTTSNMLSDIWWGHYPKGYQAP